MIIFGGFYKYGKNPISAINYFLRKIKLRYKIEFLNTQLAIKKMHEKNSYYR